MVFNFPFSAYHRSRFYPHNYYYPHKQIKRPNHYIDKKINYNSSYNYNNKTNNDLNDSNNNFVLNILGLNLYYDDILLICLIFFLYNEGVKDESLFLILILLLLS